jgi:hypothetical protein
MPDAQLTDSYPMGTANLQRGPAARLSLRSRVTSLAHRISARATYHAAADSTGPSPEAAADVRLGTSLRVVWARVAQDSGEVGPVGRKSPAGSAKRCCRAASPRFSSEPAVHVQRALEIHACGSGVAGVRLALAVALQRPGMFEGHSLGRQNGQSVLVKVVCDRSGR